MKYAVPRTNVLQAFETAAHKLKNLRYCNRSGAAKKKKLCYIACLIQSLIFRLSRMAAAAVAAYTESSLAEWEKHILSFYTLPIFFIITLFFFARYYFGGPWVLASHFLWLSYFSCVRLPTISFACYMDDGAAVRSYLVVSTSTSPFISFCALNSFQRDVTHSLFR